MAPRITPLLLRPAEVADVLGVSPRTVNRLTSAGELEPVHVGRLPRYRTADIELYVSRMRAHAAEARRTGELELDAARESAEEDGAPEAHGDRAASAGRRPPARSESTGGQS